MRYVDTNILIRLVMNDVPAQVIQIQAVIQRAAAGELVILDAILEETCTVLQFNAAYRLPRTVVYQALEQLFANKAFALSETARHALVAFGQHPKLDLADCLLLAAANGRKNRAFTFDKDLLKTLH
jgi:predicted nucleic acid-binding protein